MIIEQLKKLEDLVYEREESFLKRFSFNKDLLIGLAGIWFNSNTIKIYYILDCGQHITDNISWTDFNNWLENK
jgi:hypothetical protein